MHSKLLLRSAPARAFSGKAWWKHVAMGPKDPILGVAEAFAKDTNPKKVNLGVGAYRDDKSQPWVLPSVAQVQQEILKENHEYAGIAGVPKFLTGARNLAYGEESKAVKENKVAVVQSLGGTGALRIAGEFFARQASGGAKPAVLVPNPTWGNHLTIFGHAGLKVQEYRYWNAKKLVIDEAGFLDDLQKADPAVVLLHACAHNPTGTDPSQQLWQKISDICLKKGHFVLFDNAYQGFASGDADADVWAVRYFIDQGHNIGLCQSFSKNFGLYGQRIGTFSMLCADADEAARVESQVKIIIRTLYSNPSIHGARIVEKILTNPKLLAQWKGELKVMAGRIQEMRGLLKGHLSKAVPDQNWDFITNQIGMFCFTHLTPEQCDWMTNKHHVYLTRNGRISMAGVTTSNVAAVAAAAADAIKNVK